MAEPEPVVESAGEVLSRELAWVRPLSEYEPVTYLAQENAGPSIIFPMDSDVVDPSLGDNAHTLKQIQEVVAQLQRDTLTKRYLVCVVGLSSIDGPRLRNEALAARRAQAAAAQLNLPAGNVEAIGKGEAWDWFRAQVYAHPEGFTPEEQDRLKAIVELPDPDRSEFLLKKDGALYKKVVQSLLGTQRNASFIRVYYENKQ